MSDKQKRVWLVTGCSTGFGRELAKQLIERNENVVVTARKPDQIADLIQGHGHHVLGLELDVTDASSIENTVRQTLSRFGRIDVLVNNAGYGYQSSIEEGDEREIRAQFDANVFGLFALTRAVLPTMRKERSGHILNITSVAGLVGFAGSGYYAATKHAVEGFSSALSAEVDHLGIKVTCVEPGPFRTDWAGRSLRQTKTAIHEYSDTVGKRLAATSDGSGKQAGDPVRAASAMIKLVDEPNPPLHLVLGNFGVDAVSKRLHETLREIDDWREVSIATDYPKE
ncbi:3-phenylpropionate-dihydrodiol/cinnamic acid-dihydrodiol dehydrogenase [Halomonadaceae bacterium LMG 33818]|uniref:oxidoreductase n=1 Tax=Cernens ardua TaxID=3402176 RepID=UPI003EDC25CC